MKKLVQAALVLLAVIFAQGQIPRPSAVSGGKITPTLQRALTGAPAAKPLHVWIHLRDRETGDPKALNRALDETRAALGERVLRRRAKVRSEAGLVDVRDLPVDPATLGRVASLAIRVRAVSRWLNAVSVEARPDQVRALAAIDNVKGLDFVRSFRRNSPIPVSRGRGPETASASLRPFPPFRFLYGFGYRQVEQIGVLPLHQSGLTGAGVTVALFDVGFRHSHETFRTARLLAQRDFVMGDDDVQRNLADPSDYTDDHGTATWSLLGGYSPGRLIGPAYGADFILAKTEDDRSETPVEEDYWVAALEWAESLGVDVVSSSLGYTNWYEFPDLDGRTAVITLAADRAAELGVVVVNAAGNERDKAWGHIIIPADGFKVIAAGAVDSSGYLASFSSPGPTADGRIKPEVCAMGVWNFVATSESAGGDSGYTWGSGTSYSTPLIAGVVALLLEAHPDWTPQDVRDALMSTASRASIPDNDYGWGIINGPAANLWKR